MGEEDDEDDKVRIILLVKANNDLDNSKIKVMDVLYAFVIDAYVYYRIYY